MDLWPETLEDAKKAPTFQTEKATTIQPVQLNSISQSSESQLQNLPQDKLTQQNPPQQNLPQNNPPQQSKNQNQIIISNPIPSLLNRVPVQDSTSPKKTNFNENQAPAVQTVKKGPANESASNHKDQKKNVSTVQSSNEMKKGIPAQSKVKPTTNKQKGEHASNSEPNLPKSQQNQQQPIFNKPIGPQPLVSQPFGPQPQFVTPHQEVPFGPQPLFIPPPPMYGQPFMDTPLQFGPNPPTYVQHPCEVVVPIDPQSEMMNQPLSKSNLVQVEKNTVSSSGQTQISVPSVTVTVPNSPQKSDLREELSKKRQADNRKRGVIDQEEMDADGWSRKVFVANEDQRRKDGSGDAGPREGSHDLREKLRFRDSDRGTKGPGEYRHRVNSPQRGFNDKSLRNPPDQANTRYDAGGKNRKSPHSDRQRMSPRNDRSRDLSRERWRYKESSPEERIVRRREGSYERRVFHNPTRDTGRDRSRGKSRSRSPRRRARSPSPMVHFRDLWDNIPAVLCESIVMYKYVKQDSTTETDPYALLRATRALEFNVDFDFIKEQTAIDEWYVSVELISDKHNFHPLVGEGMARTKEEASLRAANHAVETVQKACRVIEPNLRYFCEGEEPDFIRRKSPLKTSIYEIIQNFDPGTPLAPYTIEMMFKMFISTDLEDLFFLADDFSYMERVLVIEMATKMNLWWRLFGPRHPDARPDDIVSTQHICVFKQKSALQLIRELLDKGGSTEKYKLVYPRENRLTRPRDRESSRKRW